MKFAKLFDSKKYGQLCAIAASENDEARPEIRVFFKPTNLGVCSIALIFNDTDQGWDAQEQAFYRLDLERVEAMVAEPIEKANVFGS